MDIQRKRISFRHVRRIAAFVLCATPVWSIAAPAPAPTGASFETRILAAHNAERLRVGVPALAWSADLARDARIWADALARTARFEHAVQKGQGENLWAGTRTAYAPEEMVGGWIDEKVDYRRGRFPAVSRSGVWQDVGHYTQLIWYSTVHVGCALGTNAADDTLVCRYSPPGNWIGEDAEGTPSRKRLWRKKIR